MAALALLALALPAILSAHAQTEIPGFGQLAFSSRFAVDWEGAERRENPL